MPVKVLFVYISKLIPKEKKIKKNKKQKLRLYLKTNFQSLLMLCHNLNFVWLNLRLGGCYLSQDSAFFQWPMAIGQKLDPLSQAL